MECRSSTSSAISLNSVERWVRGGSSPERLRDAEKAEREPRDGRRLSGVPLVEVVDLYSVSLLAALETIEEHTERVDASLPSLSAVEVGNQRSCSSLVATEVDLLYSYESMATASTSTSKPASEPVEAPAAAETPATMSSKSKGKQPATAEDEEADEDDDDEEEAEEGEPQWHEDGEAAEADKPAQGDWQAVWAPQCVLPSFVSSYKI